MATRRLLPPYLHAAFATSFDCLAPSQKLHANPCKSETTSRKLRPATAFTGTDKCFHSLAIINAGLEETVDVNSSFVSLTILRNLRRQETSCRHDLRLAHTIAQNRCIFMSLLVNVLRSKEAMRMTSNMSNGFSLVLGALGALAPNTLSHR